MKKIVLVCGLIAGAIVSIVLVYATIYCYSRNQYNGNMVLGYAAMLIAFSLVFVGIKNYCDKHLNGVISFGKAFKTGIYITLIASTVYVCVWLVCYYLFVPDFMEKYTAYMIQRRAAEGTGSGELEKTTMQMQQYKDMYKNPAFVILLTYAEIFPVGLLVTIVSAFILKKKNSRISGDAAIV